MQRTKTTKRQRMGLLAIGGVALIAVAAFAAQPVYFAWINPCVGLLTFYEGIGYVCEADWDDPAVWDTGDPDTYPLHGYDHPTIEKSNTGTCSSKGNPCSDDNDCGGSESCDEIELFLLLDVTTESVGNFVIRTESTAASTDFLYISFGSVTSNNTLSCRSLKLDATSGPVTISAPGDVTLQTY